MQITNFDPHFPHFPSPHFPSFSAILLIPLTLFHFTFSTSPPLISSYILHSLTFPATFPFIYPYFHTHFLIFPTSPPIIFAHFLSYHFHSLSLHIRPEFPTPDSPTSPLLILPHFPTSFCFSSFPSLFLTSSSISPSLISCHFPYFFHSFSSLSLLFHPLVSSPNFSYVPTSHFPSLPIIHLSSFLLISFTPSSLTSLSSLFLLPLISPHFPSP